MGETTISTTAQENTAGGVTAEPSINVSDTEGNNVVNEMLES